jgi:RND family efflux transporter MFP subunit
VVRAGQTLAEITGEDVRVAARSEATEQRYAAARSDHESKRRLFTDGLLSEFELRQAETALAEAKLEAERSQLTEARSKLVTPIGGVLLRLARDEQGQPLADGQLVQQGFVVAQVAPTADLVADVDLLGADVLRVRAGQVARVRHPGWKDRAFEGTIVRMAPTVDATTRTLRAEVRVDNADRVLRPGMFVEVAVVIERREEVTVVPRGAIAEREGRSWVFVLNGQKVDRHAVVLGLGDDETVEVREGVTPGQRIVVRGIETLTDGAKVRVSGT